MDRVHLLLVEDKNTREDRTKFVCENDPRWHDREGYVLNKLLRYLSERGDVHITSVLDSEVPCQVPSDVDAIVMHVDVSVNEARIIDWTARQSAERVVINGFSDLRKRAVDAHRPPDFESAMLPPDATTGLAFIKSDYNYPQAPETVHLRVRVEDIEPSMRTRQDLVVQRWMEDFRAAESGLLKTERFTYALGDLVVGERFSSRAFGHNEDSYCFCTFSRPRQVLEEDMRILTCVGLPGGERLPAFYLDDDDLWASRRRVIDHYARALRIDFAGIDAIQIERGKFAVIDINPTPWDGDLALGLSFLLSYPMLTVIGAHFLANLKRRIDKKKIGDNVPDEPRRGDFGDLAERLFQRRKLATRNILEIVGGGTRIVLVDDNTYPRDEQVGLGATVHRFYQGEGEYGSRPSDDAGAIAELERLRSHGAQYVAFVWSSFWWLKYYPGLHTYLRSTYSCVLDNTRAVVFDLRLPRSSADQHA